MLLSFRAGRSRVRLVSLLSLVLLGGAGAVVVAQRQSALNAAAPADRAGSVPAQPGDAAPSSHHAAERAGEERPVVEVESLTVGGLTQPIRVTGTVRTDESLVLSTKATGLIREVRVGEGDRVEAGQLLVVLDDRDLRARRDWIVASLRAAEARLAQTQTQRGIRNSAAAADHRRAEQSLAASRLRLSQAQSLSGIADAEAESRVASARAGLQAARERLKSLQDGARRQEKLSAEASVSRARTQVERTRAAWERREQLLREGAIAREAVDNARRDHEASLADLEVARQQLSLIQEGPRTEEIRVAEEAVRQMEAALRDADANRARRQVSREEVEAAQTQVRQAEATLDAARSALSQNRINDEEVRSARATILQARADLRLQDELIRQTLVYSPVRGIVTKQIAHVGESAVQMRNELLAVVSLDTLFVEAAAPETVLPYLRVGLPAAVQLDAQPGRTLSARLTEIIPVAEGANRSVRLRLTLPRPDRVRTVVGGFARALIRGAPEAAVLSVPRAALVSDDAQAAVFVYDGETVRRTPVTIGDAGGVGDRVPILSGLNPGDRVVVQGVEGLVDGLKVALKPGSGA